MELSLMAAQHFPAMSGAFMDSPYNGNTSLQTSTSNLHANTRPQEPEEESKFSSEAIWLWIAIIATIGNVVVVAVIGDHRAIQYGQRTLKRTKSHVCVNGIRSATSKLVEILYCHFTSLEKSSSYCLD